MIEVVPIIKIRNLFLGPLIISRFMSYDPFLDLIIAFFTPIIIHQAGLTQAIKIKSRNRSFIGYFGHNQQIRLLLISQKNDISNAMSFIHP